MKYASTFVVLFFGLMCTGMSVYGGMTGVSADRGLVQNVGLRAGSIGVGRTLRGGGPHGGK